MQILFFVMNVERREGEKKRDNRLVVDNRIIAGVSGER